MKSNLPKVLHPIAGKPMLAHVIDAVGKLDCETIALVVGYDADKVRAALSKLQITSAIQYVEQRDQLGTGHAVLQTQDSLKGKADTILVIHSDHPLSRTETLKNLIEQHSQSHSTVTMLTAHSDDSMGF